MSTTTTPLYKQIEAGVWGNKKQCLLKNIMKEEKLTKHTKGVAPILKNIFLIAAILSILLLVAYFKPNLSAQVTGNTQIKTLADGSDFNLAKVKTSTLQEVNQKLDLINSLQQRCNASDLQNECGVLPAFKTTLENYKQTLTRARNDQVYELTHDNELLSNDLPVAQVKAKFELPDKLEQLSNKLEQLKTHDSKLSPLEKQKLDSLRTKILQVKTANSRLSPKQKFAQGANNVNNFAKENELALKDAGKTLGKLEQLSNIPTARPIIKDAQKTLLEIQIESKILSTSTAINPKAQLQKTPTKKIIVLVIHWADKNSDQIINITTIRQVLTNTSTAFNEFFYNQQRVNFDICEANAGISQPATNAERKIAMIQLCDQQVDFTRYDYLYLYPANIGASRASREIIKTEEGNIDTCIVLGSRIVRSSIMHEIGHCMLLKHAHSYDCTTETWAPSGCEIEEYGDYFDTMGFDFYNMHYSAAHKNQLGFLDPITVNPNENSTTIISALETPFENQIPKAIKIKINKPNCTNLYVEYHKPITPYASVRVDDLTHGAPGYGADFAYEGLALHCTTVTSRIHTYSLDCTPNSTEYDQMDALLTTGNVCQVNFRDHNYNITFEPLSLNRARVIIKTVNRRAKAQ